MLELTTIQSSQKVGEVKRQPDQNQAKRESSDNEAAFEDEYNGVGRNDEKTAEKSNDSNANDSVKTAAETATEETKTNVDHANIEVAPIESDLDAEIGPVISEKVASLDASKKRISDDAFTAIQKNGEGTKTEVRSQTGQLADPKLGTNPEQVGEKPLTSAQAQPKAVPATIVTPAETVISSKAKENAPASQDLPAQQIRGRTDPGIGQPVPTAATQMTDKPVIPVGISAVSKPLTEGAHRAERRAKDPLIRMEPVPVAPNSKAVNFTNSTQAQFVMAPKSAAQLQATAIIGEKESKLTQVFDLDPGTNWDARSTAQSTSHTLAQTLARAETPAMIGRQMAEALQKLPDRPVEISLNPKELGRVRMNISTAEAGITVSVLAERPETLDLMRRNIDQLAKEFQSLGYDSVDFAFSQGEARQEFDHHASSNDDPPASHIDLTPAEKVPTANSALTQTTGIDIRV